MASGAPVFPSPPPATALITPSLEDSENEIIMEAPSQQPAPLHHIITVLPTGPENDEELETLSIHERLIDDAPETPTSPDTARVVDDDFNPEEFDLAFLQTEHGKILQERLTALIAAFRARSLQAKQLVMQPPPQDATRTEAAPPPPPKSEDSVAKPPHDKKADKSKPPDPPKKAPEPPPPVKIVIWKLSVTVPELFFKIPRPASFDPHSRLYLAWLAIISIAFVYNAIVIPYRSAFVGRNQFNDQDDQYWFVWLIVDYTCDAIFLADIIIFKPSIETFMNGIKVSDKKEIFRKYVAGEEFKMDILCLLPLDLFYLIPEIGINPLLRLPRLLKIHSYWEFLDRIDQVATNPYYFRVLRSFSYMMYLIHANACLFFYFSYLKNFDPSDKFVYNNIHPDCQNETNRNPNCTFPGKYNDYIFCFFFSVSMVTIIGNLNFPGLISEMLYSTVLWFVGVFIFATIVGQIRDVLKAMTRHEDEFYEVMDAIVEHMHTLKIPKDLQDRVRTWLLFNWEQQKTIDERKLLEGLPNKLRSDLAMEVHFSTVHKVQLFKDVDKKVLEEVLLRLRPSVYLPGDYICKKGEIGKEMYIIKSGILEVVLPDGRVAVTLGPGSVFGEISLLALAGGNRRTADVRSKGFSNLYVLTKADLNDVMKDYPETLDALKLKAQELMNKGKPPPERVPTPPPVEVIHTRPPTPEMVRVALSILKADSAIRRRMSQSALELNSYRNKRSADESENEDVEIAFATEPIYENQGGATPEPILDVPDGPEENSSTNSNSKPKLRRRRSQINIPSDSSSDPDDERPPGSQPRLTRQKSRQRSLRRAASSTESPKSNRHSPLPTLFPQFQSFDEGTRVKTPTPITTSKTGSLTNLRRRLFNTPKVVPLGLGPESNELDTLPSPVISRPRVFDFGPTPETTVGTSNNRSVSFSDYENSGLDDNFAGVTFSGTDTP